MVKAEFCISLVHILVLQSMYRYCIELANLMLARNFRCKRCSWLCHEAHLYLTRHLKTFPLVFLWHNMEHSNWAKDLTMFHRTVNFNKKICCCLYSIQLRIENFMLYVNFLMQTLKVGHTWQVVVSLWPSNVIPLWHLNVTWALSVLRPPSKNPFGKMPGEPQLISFVHELMT